MVFQIEKIIKDVRVCMDENMSGEQLLDVEDIDTLAHDEIIRSKVLEAVRRIHSEAPNHLLEQGHNFGDAVHWGDLESGYVLLPDDFMRLVVFEMDDWEQACYSAISTADPEYTKQRSRFKGIRGTAQKPVCVLALRPEARVLEFYSCKSATSFVRRAVYIPYPKIDDDGGVDISERCYTAVVYMTASLTLLTYGESERASALSGLAKTYLQ